MGFLTSHGVTGILAFPLTVYSLGLELPPYPPPLQWLIFSQSFRDNVASMKMSLVIPPRPLESTVPLPQYFLSLPPGFSCTQHSTWLWGGTPKSLPSDSSWMSEPVPCNQAHPRVSNTWRHGTSRQRVAPGAWTAPSECLVGKG